MWKRKKPAPEPDVCAFPGCESAPAHVHGIICDRHLREMYPERYAKTDVARGRYEER